MELILSKDTGLEPPTLLKIELFSQLRKTETQK